MRRREKAAACAATLALRRVTLLTASNQSILNNCDADAPGDLHDADDHNSRRRTDAHSSRAYSHDTHRDGDDRGMRTRERRKFHDDMHAYRVCGGRQQCSRVIAVARYGRAPCLRTMSNLDEAIWALRTALLLPLERLQSRLFFSSHSPPCLDQTLPHIGGVASRGQLMVKKWPKAACALLGCAIGAAEEEKTRATPGPFLRGWAK